MGCFQQGWWLQISTLNVKTRVFEVLGSVVTLQTHRQECTQ